MSATSILAPGGALIGKLLDDSALPDEAHAGLVFDRYLAVWKVDQSFCERKKTLGPLSTFAKAFNERAQGESTALLGDLHARLDRMMMAPPQGRIREYRTSNRLATGLGTDHPIENGFSFDSILGVPMLSGSGVKGLCRAAAKLLDLDNERIEELFGPEQIGSSPSGRGDLVFLDAYPTTWPTLCVEIVNCHYPGYYRRLEQSGTTPSPDETDDPNPVFFLAVEAGSTFVFRLRSKNNNARNLEDGAELLDVGLRELGFGAKTAVGYGVMHPVDGDETRNIAAAEEFPSPWLERTISEIAESTRSNPEEVLRGRLLAEAWADLPEGPEKSAAFDEIRRRWQTRGWWDAPQGRAQKRAFKIYSRSHR